MTTTELPQKPYFSSDTQYVGVPMYADDSSPGLDGGYYKPERDNSASGQVNLTSHHQLNGHRPLFRTILVQSFCLLWCAPISVLLYLNWNGRILGASAWCPHGGCYPQVFDAASSVPQLLAAKYDHNNHNLLGGLQFVAKALEMWFILIAAWMVYLVTMTIASRPAGLPIAYITRPNEFSEISGLLDPLLWRTLPKPFHTRGPKIARKRLWVFVILTGLLGIHCNLVGPAVAVLVLPSLQWLETSRYLQIVFATFNNAEAPSTSGSFFTYTDCTAENFAIGNYSCTSDPWGPVLDSWLDSYIASQAAWNGITQESSVSFAFNSTEFFDEDGTVSDFLSWAPSRQSMAYLSDDLTLTKDISLGQTPESLNWTEGILLNYYDSLVPVNNTVQSFLQRNGPVTGIAANMWLGYNNDTWFDSFIDGTNKAVRCYKSYDVSNTPLAPGTLTGTYTKCVQWGVGWGEGYQYRSFEIEGVWKSIIQKFGPSAWFNLWTSDKAAFLPDGVLPSGFPAGCLPEDDDVPTDLNCDWDTFFSSSDVGVMSTRSSNVNTIQINTIYAPVDGHPTSMSLMFDFVAYLNFTDYALDPSPISNPLWLATTPDLPIGGTPMLVNPAWTLAAWSADNGGIIPANRSAPLQVLHAFDRFWELDLYNSAQPLTDIGYFIDYVAIVPILQTVSLVDFNFMNTTDPTAPAVDIDHPLLQRWARINVWAYGMSGRTSYFGALVAVIGLLVALVQFVFGIYDRRPYRSPSQLLVAALEHAPSEEFMGHNHNEMTIGKTPFRVEDYEHGNASAFRFSKIW